MKNPQSKHNEPVLQTPEEELKKIPSLEFLENRSPTEYLVSLGIIGLFGIWGLASFADMPSFDMLLSPEQRAVKQEKRLVAGRDVTDKFLLQDITRDSGLPSARADETKKLQASSTCSLARGQIVDRHGNLMSTNISKYQLSFNTTKYRFQSDQERRIFAEEIAEILQSKTPGLIESFLKKSGTHIQVMEGVSSRQVQDLLMLDDRYAGLIKVSEKDARVYPKGKLFSAVIGNVNAEYCGETGLEQRFNDALQTEDKVVFTSLDERMQFIVEEELTLQMEALNAERAMGVLMDSRTGEIISQVSLPTIDTNRLNYLMNKQKSIADKYSKDQTLEGYEFGSVFKIFNTAMSLERGISLYREYRTLKPIRAGGHTFREPHPERFNLNLAGIFLRSNNIGSIRMAFETGREEQISTLISLGLGSNAWFDDPSRQGPATVANLSFGYGVKPKLVDLTAAVSSVINGGMRVKPVYGKGASGLTDQRVFSEYTSALMRQLMLSNVTNTAGTGHKAYRPGVMLGGKTGTAKLYRRVSEPGVTQNGYSEDTLTSFIGAFPMDNPRYVLSVSLFAPKDEDGEPLNAGTAVSPVAGNVAHRISLLDGLLRSEGQVRKIEAELAIPYQHEPIRVAQN